MITFLTVLFIFILIGLPALLIISICIAASRTTQREEMNNANAQAPDAGSAIKSGTKGESRKTMRKASRTPDPFLQAVEK